MRRDRRMWLRALAVALACVLSSEAAIAQPSTAAHETFVGTISRVDTQSGTILLLTGFGQIVKQRVIHLSPDVQVKGRGAAKAGLAAVAPGAVCRVVCNEAAAGTTAYSVEVLRPAVGRSH